MRHPEKVTRRFALHDAATDVCACAARVFAYTCVSAGQTRVVLMSFSSSSQTNSYIDVGTKEILEMCIIADSARNICSDLVCALGDRGLCCYKISAGKITNEVIWQVRGKFGSMDFPLSAKYVVSGNNQLFVYDNVNSCIQMLSFKGEYKGLLLRRGDRGIGVVRKLMWCSRPRSSLIVGHGGNFDSYEFSMVIFP